MSKMNLSGSLTPQNKINLKPLYLVSSIIIAAIAVFATLNYFSGMHNSGKIVIKDGETMTFDVHLINDAHGVIVQEGIAYFKGDIYNKGTMNCGSCQTGTTFFNTDKNRSQYIKGPKLLRLHDVVLDNANTLQLDAELQVANKFEFKSGYLITPLDNPDHSIHFLEGSSVMGANNDQHVVGYVSKAGSTDFSFPIGDGKVLRKLGIAGMETESTVNAAYITFAQEQVINKSNRTISAEQLDKDIDLICLNGFWKISSINPIHIYFFWDSHFELVNVLDNLSELTLVGWNGKKWEAIPFESITGSVQSGSISTREMNPEEYIAYSLAVKRNEKS